MAIYPKAYGHHDDQRAFKDAAREQLKAIVHQSPRDFDCESSMWMLSLLAEVSYQGLTDRLVHQDTVGETLHQLGVDWKKAKRHIQSPDAHYRHKKTTRLAERTSTKTSRLVAARRRRKVVSSFCSASCLWLVRSIMSYQVNSASLQAQHAR